VQPVGQLDEDDPDVPHHGQQHLAEVLRLSLGAALEGHLLELADAVDQLGHRLAEFAPDVLLGDVGVLEHVVQDGRDDALVVHAHLGEPGR